jgi:site-specific DNA-methyltransferase (adenine-specific)
MTKTQHQILTSSASQHWNTPEKVLKFVRAMGEITLDPCSNNNSIVEAKHEIAPPQDGLAVDWHVLGQNGITFVNPPYGRGIAKWIQKAVLEYAKGAEIIMLVPARVDTKWWQNWIFPTANAICFWKGRLVFEHPDKPKLPATFPSAIVYFGPNPDKFVEVFEKCGVVLCP